MIKALITDFDGTLVDTFDANLRAYQKAFADVGITLTAERYRECFGYRFDRFMTAMGIYDAETALRIKEAKKEYYPMQPGDVYKTYADVTDLMNDFNFKPNTTIREGLEAFAKWHKEYYKY